MKTVADWLTTQLLERHLHLKGKCDAFYNLDYTESVAEIDAWSDP